MALTIPYAPRDAATHKRVQESSGSRFLSLFKDGYKSVVIPKEDTQFDIRVLAPTWNALDPYGEPLVIENVKAKNIPDNPFFKLRYFRQVGPSGAKLLCTQQMLRQLSGAGAETAHALFEALGGNDPIFENWQAESKDLERGVALKKGPATFWAAWVIDRRDPPETAMPKLFVVSDFVFQKFLKSVTKKNGACVPYDAWDETGMDLRVTVKGGMFGSAKSLAYYPEALAPIPVEQDERTRAVLRENREEAIARFVYANPIPRILNFLTAERLQQELGVSAARGPVDAAAELPSWSEEAEQAPAPKAKKSARPVEVLDEEESASPETFKPASAKVKAPAIDDDEDDAPPAKPATTMKQATKLPARTLTAEDLDDEDELGVAAPKKAKKAPVVEDEEDAPAPVAAKKKAPAVASLEDDDDDVGPIRPAAKASKPAPAAAPKKKAPPVAAGGYDDDE
jgi:hypothetical protein